MTHPVTWRFAGCGGDQLRNADAAQGRQGCGDTSVPAALRATTRQRHAAHPVERSASQLGATAVPW